MHISIQEAEATQLSYELLTHPTVRTLFCLVYKVSLSLLRCWKRFQNFRENIRRYANSVIMSVMYGNRITTLIAVAYWEMQEKWINLLSDIASAHWPNSYSKEGDWAIWIMEDSLQRRLKHAAEAIYSLAWPGRATHGSRRSKCLSYGDSFRKGEGMEFGSQKRSVCSISPQSNIVSVNVLPAISALRWLRGDLTRLRFSFNPCSSFYRRIRIPDSEVQQKAQQEIDNVIGLDRMPVIDDIEMLPYVQAIINKVGSTRFWPSAALTVL